MRNKTSRKLAVTGALGALTIILGITRLGFIPWFSGASITILQVPVIIGAILEGPLVGIGIGAIFGIFSLIQAAIAPTGVFDPFFINPLISILPRLLIGPVTWGLYVFIKKWQHLPAVIVATFFGAISNSIFVLMALVLARAITWAIFGVIFVSNGIIEAIASTIISTIVISMWKNIDTRKKSHLSKSKKKDPM